MLNYKGPMLWLASFIHDSDVDEERIRSVIDDVIEQVRTTPVDEETLARAKVKWRSAYYDGINSFFGFGRADLLASLALFDDNPHTINEFEARIAEVTPELMLETAKEYLRPGNRTVLILEAGAAESTQEGAGNE